MNFPTFKWTLKVNLFKHKKIEMTNLEAKLMFLKYFQWTYEMFLPFLKIE